jgi:hypothetical protein
MKSTNIILVAVLALVAFMFMKNSQAATTTTTSKTVGITPSTGQTISDIIGGLVSIFGKGESPYTTGD